ncbi:protein of unknown function (plasmid) [Cupriavidus taiwanensis]|uniref:Uncharacterized protein n=1 Tax=Cupriavidus taiwanensis TaxID=164546 RepID=A0A7Z7JAA7_9BURK|nr:protein of unknown function [Cupriavidus taiwanensis]SOZ13140.1 protein of unknown function [Cupriavidus taiwanensis]SOZ41715.1 protein of unknown function [Cupriavidus taiwanensis]SPC21048.1 protein of unknown function [Cupriavidus taiwanensis]SPD55190.1 protein of unknown function [Cupriavidus taiwanensis]
MRASQTACIPALPRLLDEEPAFPSYPAALVLLRDQDDYAPRTGNFLRAKQSIPIATQPAVTYLLFTAHFVRQPSIISWRHHDENHS